MALWRNPRAPYADCGPFRLVATPDGHWHVAAIENGKGFPRRAVLASGQSRDTFRAMKDAENALEALLIAAATALSQKPPKPKPLPVAARRK